MSRNGRLKARISVVVPAYNEEKSLDTLGGRLRAVAAGMPAYDFEFIIVENGSADRSYEKLLRMNREDPRLKVLRLSRNFGCEGAISAGLSRASGDAAIVLFADLQEPPEMIPRFIEKWEEGYDVVYGVLKNRSDLSFVRKVLYTGFYKVMSALTSGVIPENATDFRLMDRKVFSLINGLGETNKFMRGISAWVGFAQARIPYERAPRFAGESKANYATVVLLAVNAIVNFSSIPLQIATVVGFLTAIISFLVLLAESLLFVLYGRALPGIATLTLVMLFSFGMVFFFLGVVGIYVGKIYEELKGRPDYIVSQAVGFGRPELAIALPVEN